MSDTLLPGQSKPATATTNAGSKNASPRTDATALQLKGLSFSAGAAYLSPEAAEKRLSPVQHKGDGVQLNGGVGRPGDRYEQHADQVADLVVQGESAQPLLDQHAGSTPTASVQRKLGDEAKGAEAPPPKEEKVGGAPAQEVGEEDKALLAKWESEWLTADVHQALSSRRKVYAIKERLKWTQKLGGGDSGLPQIDGVSYTATPGRGKTGYWEVGYGKKTPKAQYGDLYGGGKKGVLFDGPPKPTDVIQSHLNDCWFLGPLASIAAADPGYIQGTLMQQAGATVTCNLFLPIIPKKVQSADWSGLKLQSRAVTVSLAQLPVRTDDEGEEVAAYARTDRKAKKGKTILWVAALENALAKVFEEFKVRGKGRDGYEHMHFNSASVGMMILTGRPVVAVDKRFQQWETGEDKATGLDKAKMTKGWVAVRLQEDLAAGMPVSAGTVGHQFAVLAATNGPTRAQMATLESAGKSGDNGKVKQAQAEIDAALETLVVTIYDQVKGKPQEIYGWTKLTARKELSAMDRAEVTGFNFGDIPQSKAQGKAEKSKKK